MAMLVCLLKMSVKTTCEQKISIYIFLVSVLIFGNTVLTIMDLPCTVGWQTIESFSKNSSMIAEIQSAENTLRCLELIRDI